MKQTYDIVLVKPFSSCSIQMMLVPLLVGCQYNISTSTSAQAGLQRLMNKLNDTAKKYNMKINIQKTKVMVATRDG